MPFDVMNVVFHRNAETVNCRPTTDPPMFSD
jgi:hypothetical protein